MKIKNFLIDDVAARTTTIIEEAAAKHKSFRGLCIFVEGNRYYALVPHYETPEQQQKIEQQFIEALIANPDLCDRLAGIVLPAHNYHKREAKRNAKMQKCQNEKM